MGLIHSNNAGLVIPKGKLCEVGQGLLVADSHSQELDGDFGKVTLDSDLRWLTCWWRP